MMRFITDINVSYFTRVRAVLVPLSCMARRVGSSASTICLKGCGFLDVRYLEVMESCPLGTWLLSAVRNQEASASQRLCKYYNYGIFNP